MADLSPPNSPSPIRLIELSGIATDLDSASELAACRALRRIGRRLMLAIEAFALRQALPAVVLHAQVIAIPFYERLGYRAYGEIFLDAGIDHREMTKRLD